MATSQKLADALSRMSVNQSNQTLNQNGIPTNIESFGVNGSVGDKFRYNINNSRIDDPNVIKKGIDNVGFYYTPDSGKTYDVSGGYNTLTSGDVKTNVGRISFGLPITEKLKVIFDGSHTSNPYYKRTGLDAVRTSYTGDNGENVSLDANLQPNNLGGMLYFRMPIK